MKVVILALALAGIMALPGAASAEWMLSRSQARQHAIGAATDRYEDYNTDASCRPQRHRLADTHVSGRDGRTYSHRWICSWWAEYDNPDGTTLECSGTLLILGRFRVDSAWYEVLDGERCY